MGTDKKNWGDYLTTKQ